MPPTAIRQARRFKKFEKNLEELKSAFLPCPTTRELYLLPKEDRKKRLELSRIQFLEVKDTYKVKPKSSPFLIEISPPSSSSISLLLSPSMSTWGGSSSPPSPPISPSSSFSLPKNSSSPKKNTLYFQNFPPLPTKKTLSKESIPLLPSKISLPKGNFNFTFSREKNRVLPPTYPSPRKIRSISKNSSPISYPTPSPPTPPSPTPPSPTSFSSRKSQEPSRQFPILSITDLFSKFSNKSYKNKIKESLNKKTPSSFSSSPFKRRKTNKNTSFSLLFKGIKAILAFFLKSNKKSPLKGKNSLFKSLFSLFPLLIS